MKQVRVLILFSTSALGGAERSLTRMALSPGVIHYEFATLQNSGPWCDWLKSLGGAPIMFGSEKNHSNRITLGACLRLIAYLHRHKFDALYVCGVRASFFLRLLRILMPKIKVVHGVRSNLDSNSKLDQFFRLIERYTHPLVDAWVTNSFVTKKTLQDRCNISERKIEVIHNGLEKLPEHLPIFSSRPREILTIANLNLRKGYLEYLAVIQDVIQQEPTVKFVFIGRDDMNGVVQAAILEKKLDSHIRYESFQADVSPWLRSARIFVLPSLWGEGCPTSILEAYSFEIPVIAYAIDGIPELISNNVDGYLVPKLDSETLKDKILELIRNPEQAERFGKDGRRKVENEFTLVRCANRHAQFFSKLCHG
jgi:glycosyltransferase involved in cell wall biosynthesis